MQIDYMDQKDKTNFIKCELKGRRDRDSLDRKEIEMAKTGIIYHGLASYLKTTKEGKRRRGEGGRYVGSWVGWSSIGKRREKDTQKEREGR